MSHYTIQQGPDRLWHILKDGKSFTLSHSKLSAERMIVALNAGNTPTPTEYKASEVIDDRPSGKWMRLQAREVNSEFPDKA